MIRLLTAVCLLIGAVAARADDPPANPEKDVDVAKATEQVVQDAKEAGKRLADKDPGSDTQQIQKNILKNLDDLLRKANQPPPPNNGGSSSQNKGGMGGSSKQQPTGGSSSSAAQRKERREKMNNEMAKGNGQPNPQPATAIERIGRPKDFGGGRSSPNKTAPKESARPPQSPDTYKDAWGQLQEKNREEMARYYREYFDPRYADLLDQYYSSLSERNAKNKP